MDAELQIGRKMVFLHSESDGGQIVGKLFAELRNVALVIDTFIKSACKLRRNGLDRNAFVGNRDKNDQ